MANLIIYDSSVAWSLTSAAIAAIKYSDMGVHTFLDLKGLTEANITTAIGNLDTGVYTEIIFCVTTESDGSDATITTEHMSALYDCLITASQGTIVGTAHTNAETHTTTQIGDTGAAWTPDALIGNWVITTGGTGVGQLALISDNAAETVTITGVFATEPDATTDFEIWEDIGFTTGIYVSSGDKFPPAYVWEYLFPTNSVKPLVLKYLSDPNFSVCYGQATSVAAGSLTHTGAFAGLTLDDYYVYVWDASTLGKYQVAKIASNTNDALTLDANWEHTPTGTVIYKVVKEYEDVLLDAYATLYILTYMFDLSDSSVLYDWTKLLGLRGSADIELWTKLPPVTDMDFLVDTVLAKGKIMVDYVRESEWR